MKTNPPKEGLIRNSASTDTLTSEMVWARAIAIAFINGRSAQDVMHSDLQRAKRQLTRNSDSDRNGDCKP